MELLPPVGWADVATKQDLVILEQGFLVMEARLEARFERGFRQVLVTTASLMVTGFAATIAAVLTR